MTKINESGQWEDSVYQIQRGDKVIGGRDGVANIQPQQLANRTQYLKQAIEGLSVGEQPFDNVEKAQAKINDGSIPLNARFSVRIESTDAWLAEYKNMGGVATATGKTLPSGELVKKITDYFYLNDAIGNLLVDMVDEDYFSVWRLFDNGAFGTIKSLLSPQGIFLDDLKITHAGDRPGVIYQDADDFVVEIVGRDGVPAPKALQGHGKFSTLETSDAWLRLEDVDGFYRDYIDLDGNPLNAGSGGVSEFDLVAHDAQNKAYSQSVRDRYNADIQRLVSALNHLLMYSQSLGTQFEDGPPSASYRQTTTTT